ncbi:MAG: hypothetical protein E7399_05455 [Ruminococcaceae bacterium]|nr:hypothetical protein [Oscillospiraceae bacterium]
MKKILLIGDSIRMGYDKYVEMAFENRAKVYYPSENCRFTSYIIRNLYDWKNQLECGDDVDLVHWNAGLWDDLVMIDQKPLISLDVYKENIERICTIIKLLFPKASMIFATSTPVQEELFTFHKRYNRDTECYNEAACAIVKNHGGEINDLYTLMKQAPTEYHSDLTHYYTKEGTELITNQVIKCIEENLAIKGRSLDYDQLFHKKEKILGI